MDEPYDLCWLDCPEPGFLKQDGGREICLCVRHTLLLEQGKCFGDYSGAPLPPESVAVRWPWRTIEPLLV